MAKRKLNYTPPKWAMRFFRWYCRKDLVDGMEGDMLELYQRRVEDRSRSYANFMFVWNVIKFFQPYALKPKSEFHHRLTVFDLLFNYLKIAFRNLLKSKSFTAINVLGLAIGISGFMMMTAYVFHELSFDRFHEKSDRIQRITYSLESSAGFKEYARIPYPVKSILLNNYPEVETLTRFYRNTLQVTTLRKGDLIFSEENILFTDPEVFQVFDFDLEIGDPATALSTMNSIVMTRKAARKYFGEENPIGQTIEYQNNDVLVVTGILAELPENSHIQFDMLVPLELQRQRWIRGGGNNRYDLEEDWKWSGALTYVLLKDTKSIASFNQKLALDGKDFFGRRTNNDFAFKGFPLEDIHLYSDMSGEFAPNGNLGQVIGFAGIALLILVIACINFINLSTARSAQRAKEVGLRKVMGALRPQLIWQFISESLLITFLAMTIGVLLVELLLPFFNLFMDKQLSIPYFDNPLIIVAMILGAGIIGLFSGLYPAFYLSRFQPSKTLKGNLGGDGRGSVRTRKFLVASQFVISNLLIIGILVVQAQLDYIKSKDLGFDKDQILVLKHGAKIDDRFSLFSSRLASIPNVEGSNLGYVAGKRAFTQSFTMEGKDSDTRSMGIKFVNYDFNGMFDIEIVEGRNFSREIFSDSSEAILLNESAVEFLGLTNEEALGKRLSWVGGSDNRTKFDCRIIGIMKDANFESLYQPISPSVFKFSQWGEISIKLNVSNAEEIRTVLGEIKTIWDDIAPTWPFEYSFLNDELETQYIKEERLGQTIQYFTGIAIFIACLGLFGLASYTVQQKRKEIGVRKVLGASLQSILLLVSKSFIGLITISFLLAAPMGYWLSIEWLNDFAFRVSVGPEFFLLAGLISLGIAFLAISSQSIKAAATNPVKTLRHE